MTQRNDDARIGPDRHPFPDSDDDFYGPAGAPEFDPTQQWEQESFTRGGLDAAGRAHDLVFDALFEAYQATRRSCGPADAAYRSGRRNAILDLAVSLSGRPESYWIEAVNERLADQA